MNADQLLKHYDRVADAPHAVARMRRFILDLAVRGKLVPQDPRDKPAQELVKQMELAKARLAKNAKANQVEMLEPRFELPESWIWAALGTVFEYDAGAKREPKLLDQSLWLLELEDVEKDTGRLIERVRVKERSPQSTKSEFRVGDILYGKLRPYLNKVLVADRPGYSTTEIVAIRPFVPLSSEYCAVALRCPDFVEYVTRVGQGTKMPRLRTEDAIVAPFPLPPLAEQHRIVAKVDELMALCDRLDVARGEREAARDRLAVASLARLNAPDPETLKADARFALDALTALTARPDQIKQLRQTILNLAVRGKLVPQDPDDEPASEVVNRILTERLSFDNRSQKKTSVQEVCVSERQEESFPLPMGWCWVRIGDLAEVGTGLTPPKANPIYHDNGEVPWVNSADTAHGIIRQVDHFVTRMALKECRLKLYPAGSLIVALYGQGKTRGQVAELGIDATVNQACAVIQWLSFSKESKEFVHIALRQQYEAMRNQAEGGPQPNLNVSKVRQRILAFPPIAEQHRIVAKVNELIALCDRMESDLTAGENTRRCLFDALLHASLEPSA